VRFIIDRDCDGTDFDIFIQDADGNIFGFWLVCWLANLVII
jgi:hypothetical protein